MNITGLMPALLLAGVICYWPYYGYVQVNPGREWTNSQYPTSEGREGSTN
jgi:hypothetical protein